MNPWAADLAVSLSSSSKAAANATSAPAHSPQSARVYTFRPLEALFSPRAHSKGGSAPLYTRHFINVTGVNIAKSHDSTTPGYPRLCALADSWRWTVAKGYTAGPGRVCAPVGVGVEALLAITSATLSEDTRGYLALGG